MAIMRLSTVLGILRLRCPRCCLGDVFRGHFSMNEECPVCGLHFERGPGYFLGALYISYPLSILLLGSFILGSHWIFPGLRWEWDVLIAALVYIPWTPAVFRYSRIIWIYFDRWASPGEH
jgi:uncharacterized protein (DUF983 family)